MKIFILLCILGLKISQAKGQDNSTQMYYAKLTIEENAIRNITEILRPFVSNTSLSVDQLEKTTICQGVSDGTQCTCEPHYRWSDKVCKDNQQCCGKNKCTFPKNSSHVCVSDSAVTVTGSIILNGQQYYNCLAEKTSMDYQLCNTKLTEALKMAYSTLRGFDILKIKQYRVGSIIADFEMIIAYSINPQDLINKSELLSKNLSASFILETVGVVHLSMPTNYVCYNTQHILNCTVHEDLNTQPAWQLKGGNQTYDITNGTESGVTVTTLETSVTLKNVSELWAGEYTCLYYQTSKSHQCTVTNKASAVMDVSLLPQIEINMEPSFPRCTKSSDFINIRIQCDIESSSENYNVTWSRKSITAEIRPLASRSSEGSVIYEAVTVVSCDASTVTSQITCAFKNRCKQERTASIDVNIIYGDDQFCEAEGDWEDTKAGFTAVLKCKDAIGQRRRKCQKGTVTATWEAEVSVCVSREVNNVIQKAKVVDIGLGSLDGNAAHVFSLLEVVTNNSDNINTIANLNTSVEVLFTLSQKRNLQQNESTADVFLESSSNMLNQSLEKSWKTYADEGNTSMAERYLISVEQLIQTANIKGKTAKKNLEVAARNCQERSECTNKVFNATIQLDSTDPGNVKTAGFKELEKYLPNDDDEYMPNSIVVSTTREQKRSDSVAVTINFPLLKPRPRNVEMQCVSWDTSANGWSSQGCQWERGGSSDQGKCVCSHLSSFAILMAQRPLNITGLTQITYVGLSVSVLSLVMSLAIELAVWSAVVKTNTLYLRHTAHINISLCLLVADCCLLASLKTDNVSEIWCKALVVLKQFCYLSMFFWMLCLSMTLLHQAVFLFHDVSKKTYLRFSLVLGYVCPLLIVTITILAYKNGAEGFYFSRETCWLVYDGQMKGSIHAFVIPVGIIVLINVFSMVLVTMKLLSHPKSAQSSHNKQKKAAVTAMRTVILLTPVFGVTWIFGFAVMLLDLTDGFLVYAANYIFTLLNAFQGLFILLTTCLGDKLTRDALLSRLKKHTPASFTDSSMKLDSSIKK
uniref:adhesion G-protein coupled receptor F1 n=1 Tax=Scatophagus argus TaxID=75038 RepID=UPI001ED856FD|nr:adhesion G-protein coupled receptor F1 [Scatophagus argus]XP_046268740.1 adhesion G-protein coupled receptor F1 [Scatophagus argus]